MESNLSKKVSLITKNGKMLNAELVCCEEDPNNIENVLLRLIFQGQTLEGSSEIGFFDALCDIRKELEKNGLRIICYGASRNVYPSPMIRSMGTGEKAYKLTMGKQALNEDLVSIFNAGPDIDPVTIEEQEYFYTNWLKSL